MVTVISSIYDSLKIPISGRMCNYCLQFIPCIRYISWSTFYSV